MYCWLLLQIYLLLMTAFVLQGHILCESEAVSLTFFILKDSSSSLSTARMFSIGMLHRAPSPGHNHRHTSALMTTDTSATNTKQTQHLRMDVQTGQEYVWLIRVYQCFLQVFVSGVQYTFKNHFKNHTCTYISIYDYFIYFYVFCNIKYTHYCSNVWDR